MIAKADPNFAALEPAIKVTINVGSFHDLGVTHTGSRLNVIESTGGVIETIPGFEPAFKATYKFGGDWLAFDPSGEYARLNLQAVAHTDEGAVLSTNLSGIITMADDVKKIFMNAPDKATVPYGRSSGAWTFITSDPKLKVLEDSQFVGVGRLKVTEDGNLVVENNVSKVVKLDE
ncbi:hypothetical protein Micbo1qcDRAFT_179096 [Microdochium bolleyi]|uniref:Uncharacterized protein n=1 Tax=Microdochium bolleyi TaxID=196109 RepID=A0A136IQM3_9PEZI|nr:hypothetical protein Micbo1qcDRAFT_179096 [Microdochium bolleyi]